MLALRGLELLLKWYHQESNRGHKDFQSFALPTELWYHLFCVSRIVVAGDFLVQR